MNNDNNQFQNNNQSQQPMPEQQTNNQLNGYTGNINQTYTDNYSMPNKKTVIWESYINGKNYKFNCQFKNAYQYDLSINESEPMALTHKSFGKMLDTFVIDFEKDFVFDNINMRLVVPSSFLGNNIRNADVIVDNKFSRTGKEYVSAPKWVYIFVILCLLVIIGGGAIPFLLAFCGITGCLKVAKSNKSTGLKVISCVGITFAVWFAFLLLGVIVVSLT